MRPRSTRLLLLAAGAGLGWLSGSGCAEFPSWTGWGTTATKAPVVAKADAAPAVATRTVTLAVVGMT